MANRWGKVEIVTYFIFLGSKIIADKYCSHEIKRHLLLGRRAVTKLDSIFKSRDITLLTKVHIVKSICIEKDLLNKTKEIRELKRVIKVY